MKTYWSNDVTVYHCEVAGNWNTIEVWSITKLWLKVNVYACLYMYKSCFLTV